MLSFTGDADGVTARFATSEGEQTLRARWLVGADGALSPVRKSCGITFEDLGFKEPRLVVGVLVDGPSRLPTANLQICDPARPTTCVMMGEGRHRWEFMILPGETREQVCTDAAVERMLARGRSTARCGSSARPSTPFAPVSPSNGAKAECCWQAMPRIRTRPLRSSSARNLPARTRAQPARHHKYCNHDGADGVHHEPARRSSARHEVQPRPDARQAARPPSSLSADWSGRDSNWIKGSRELFFRKW